jgi:hypothetical protein
MKNDEINAAWAYHNGTKHSLRSVREGRHFLDWENQPLPFKIYRHLEALRLPEDLSSSGVPALSALSTSTSDEGRAVLTRQSLAEILFLSAGITRRRTYPGGEMLFRAAACTGALYHIDLYIVGVLEDLKAGVYQFSPQGAVDRNGVMRRCLRFHVLAQCMEISVARVPALFLGHRDDHRQLIGRGVSTGNSSKCCGRLRRHGGKPACGLRCRARGADRAGGSGQHGASGE